MSSASPAFTPSNFQTVDSMTERELDLLPHGVIQLDAQGTVLKFNAYEERLAGMKKETVVGKNFFKQVAPCTDVKEFYGRFREGITLGKLHCKFRYRFAFKQNPRDVTVTLFYSERNKTVWVFVQPISPNE
jgi:photoactive yellow protein